MAPICNGQRVIIIGSAPNLAFSALPIGDVIIAANGGAGLIPESPDILCTTSYLFRPGTVSRQEIATRDLLRGVSVQSTYVDTLSGPLDWAQTGLASLDACSKHWIGVNPVSRAEVILTASGTSGRVSTGLFAACLAVTSGATEVVICGISLSSGHMGMSWDYAPRDHIEADRACLAGLRKKLGERMLEVA